MEITQDQLNSVSDEAAYNFLKDYNGNFSFLHSLKAAYFRYNKLSYAQLLGAKKCLLRQQEFEAKKAADEAKPANDESFSIKQGAVFKVPKYLGETLAEKVGLPRLHRQFEVLNVLAETHNSFKLEIKASGKRMSCCSICGRSLTDPYSVAHGIGSTCAKKYGITNAEELDTMLTSQAKPILVEIKKWQVQNPAQLLDSAE
jgi:Family of unknown function (DUF6011)